ncbi:MAG: glycosyltransferase family 2 protein [Streptococcaceae bacterium]|jgi:glucosyltransferase|nr:glycosyltransferase family 2 protein [Streptococcaceae bacterium]
MKSVAIIIPCYNEAETIELYLDAMQAIEQAVSYHFNYLFINDGSQDTTLKILQNLAKAYSNVNYLSFSRNFGKEAALLAGLKTVSDELIIVMDVDLQDPPELIPKMLVQIEKGYDIVATRRKDRTGEPLFRSLAAKSFYYLINKISDTPIVDGARDFRLMNRQVVDSILKLDEVNRFSKGLFSWVGFDTYYIPYENHQRSAGKTSWSFWEIFKYSLEGIVNFSEAPLNIATVTGFFSCLGAGGAMLYFFITSLIDKNPVPGWPSLVCIILFLGGMQLFCLGILGKYISKIFLEVKKRPSYIIKESSIKTKSII